MTLNFLIVDDNMKTRASLKKKLLDSGFTAETSNLHDDVMTLFYEYIPNIVVMNYNDLTLASKISKNMVEVDHTVCIFGIVSKVSEEIKAKAFSSGIRALIESNTLLDGSDSAEEIISTITSGCNELQNDQCVKCWEKNVFSDLKVIH